MGLFRTVVVAAFLNCCVKNVIHVYNSLNPRAMNCFLQLIASADWWRGSRTAINFKTVFFFFHAGGDCVEKALAIQFFKRSVTYA